MLHFTRLVLWRLTALIALALGIVGLALPILPTVPFFILAAWAASKGSPALERWLLAHPAYGPHIRAWRESGAVPRKAKWLATLGMTGSAVLLQLTSMPLWARIVTPMAMAIIALWLWHRPETNEK
jgi:uncharacterized protein